MKITRSQYFALLRVLRADGERLVFLSRSVTCRLRFH
jgi:hypothetical protein